MNIVQIISKLLENSNIIEKIAAMLGIDKDQATKAVGAAIPTILAGLSGAASKPGGAAKLAEVAGNQDPGLLDNLGGLLAGGDQSASQGIGMLGNVLGEEGLGKIGGVLSRFTGMSEGSIGKLLGMLGPIIMGVISKHAKGSDAHGLANMLADQKGNIASAIPGGLGEMLGSAVPGLKVLFSDAGDTASTAVDAVKETSRQAVQAAETASPSPMKWLVPLILLILAVVLLPRMCRKASDVTDQAKQTMESAAGSTKLISDAGGMLKDATETIGSITDEASAEAALPKLRELETKIGGLQGMLDKLPVAARDTVFEALRPLIAKLRETAAPVLAMPVVGAKIRPVVDSLFGQLDALIPPA